VNSKKEILTPSPFSYLHRHSKNIHVCLYDLVEALLYNRDLVEASAAILCLLMTSWFSHRDCWGHLSSLLLSLPCLNILVYVVCSYCYLSTYLFVFT